MQRQRCEGPGNRLIYATKAEAKGEAVTFRAKNNGRGKVYRCSYGEHYHITRGFMGSAGRRGGK